MNGNLHVTALQEASTAPEAVALGPEALCIAAFAVDVIIGGVATQDGVEGPFAVPASKTFLQMSKYFRQIRW